MNDSRPTPEADGPAEPVPAAEAAPATEVAPAAEAAPAAEVAPAAEAAHTAMTPAPIPPATAAQTPWSPPGARWAAAPGQPTPGQPVPAQQAPGQQAPGQAVPGRPELGQPLPGQPALGQPQHGQHPFAQPAFPPVVPGRAPAAAGLGGPGASAAGLPPAPPLGWAPPAAADGAGGPLPSVPPAGSRHRWWPVVGAAAAAALLASAGTAGIVRGLDSHASTTTVSLASLAPQTSSVVPVASSTNASPNWEAVADAVRPSVVAIQVTLQGGQAEGSGVILDAKGHILTNNHVVAGATGDVEVTLFDGRVLKGTVAGTDETTDLAVVTLTNPPKDLVPAVIGASDKVQVGQPVMAVGNPLGLSSTVTTGIVSALDRPVSTSSGGSTVVTNAIQIDAAINPGNSGGPLFDATGRVIGITSSIATLSGGSGESGSIGLGFAIPSKLADRIAAELLSDGSASHAYLGVSLEDGTATADGVTRRGAAVHEVTDGTPAAKAGLKAGDVIVAIGGAPTTGAESLTGYVRELAPGQSASLTVVRDGKSFDVDVTFAALPASAQQGGSGSGSDGSGNGSGGSGDGSGGLPGFGGRPGNGSNGSGSNGSSGSGSEVFPGLPGLPWGQQG